MKKLYKDFTGAASSLHIWNQDYKAKTATNVYVCTVVCVRICVCMSTGVSKMLLRSDEQRKEDGWTNLISVYVLLDAR